MNKNIDLVKILRGRNGMRIYSTLFGYVTFTHIRDDMEYPIAVETIKDKSKYYFTNEGKFDAYDGGECVIFPSKSECDWNKFYNEPTWNDFGIVSGWFVNDTSEIVESEPMSSDETNKNTFPTMEEALACFALSQLIQWRDKYNGNWKPNWNEDDFKFVIQIYKNEIKIERQKYRSSVLHFKYKTTANRFKRHFEDLIKIAIPLL